MGLGVRTGRYALIIDDLVVKYAEVRAAPAAHPLSLTLYTKAEPGRGVTVSGADAVLAAL